MKGHRFTTPSLSAAWSGSGIVRAQRAAAILVSGSFLVGAVVRGLRWTLDVFRAGVFARLAVALCKAEALEDSLILRRAGRLFLRPGLPSSRSAPAIPGSLSSRPASVVPVVPAASPALGWWRGSLAFRFWKGFNEGGMTGGVGREAQGGWSTAETLWIAALAGLPFMPSKLVYAVIAASTAAFLFRLPRWAGFFRFPGGPTSPCSPGEPAPARVVSLGPPIAALSAALVGATLGSMKPLESTVALGSWILALAAFGTALRMFRAHHVSLAAHALLLAGAVVSLIGLYQYLQGVPTAAAWIDPEQVGAIQTRVYGPFTNPTMLAEYLVMILPVGLVLLAEPSTWKRRVLLGGFCVLVAASLLLTYSRGGWLSALAAVVLVAVLRDRRFLPLLLIGVLVVLVLVPDSVLVRAASVVSREDTSTLYRLSIWEGSLRMARVYWFTGIGLGPSPFAWAYSSFMIAGIRAHHAHNTFLQFLLETGIAGLLALVWLLAAFLFQVIPAARRPGRSSALAAAFMAGALAQLFHGLVDHVWFNPRLLILFWMTLGLAGATVRFGARTGPGAGPGSAGTAGVVFGAEPGAAHTASPASGRGAGG